MSRLLLAAGILGLFAIGPACQTGPENDLDAAMQDYVRDGEVVPGDGITQYTGTAANPGQLRQTQTGIFAIRSQEDLNQIWANQCADQGDAPRVDFSQQIVLACFLTRSSASSLSFYRMVLGAERVWAGHFIGRMEALSQVRYNYPYCIAVIDAGQAANRPVVAKIVRIRERVNGGYEVAPSGEYVDVR